MAPLDRAVTLEEVDQRAVLVTQDLDLDVPGPLDGPLDVDRRVAERGPGAPLRGGERRLEPLRPGHERHADAAPAGGGLQHDRIADRVGDLPGRPGARDGPVGPGQAPGTPARATSRRASVFWPMVRSTSGGGPTKVRPAFRQASAKRQFSDRNP